MKTLYIALLFLLSAIISPVEAAETGPYVGAEFEWRSISRKDFGHLYTSLQAPGGGAFIGTRVNQLFGIEFGIHLVKTKHRLGTLKVRGLNFNLYGFMTMVPNKLDFVIGAGLSHLKHTKEYPAYRIDVSRLSPKVQTGLEINLCRQIRLRLLMIYETPITFKKKSYRPLGSLGGSIGLIIPL